MKEPWDWEEEDIELLIQDGVQESLTLDYKRCASLEPSLEKSKEKRKEELSKDVSAFANSAGGTIVYGVLEDSHLPTKIDNGYDPKEVTREWLEQVINSTIQRRIDGIRIKQIELRKSNPGRVIYIVSIPQSKHAPHMAKDHIFYKRFNYQSVPMEEYEVRDVSSRADVPDLSLDFSLEGNLVNAEIESVKLEVVVVNLEFEEDEELSKPIALNLTIINEAIAPAMYFVAKLFVDKRLTMNHSCGFKAGSERSLQLIDIEFIMNSHYRNYSVPHFMPIWKGVRFDIGDQSLKIAIPKVNRDVVYGLAWTIDSVGMETKFGGAILTVSNNCAGLLKVPAAAIK